jgi:hypothetical protein
LRLEARLEARGPGQALAQGENAEGRGERARRQGRESGEERGREGGKETGREGEDEDRRDG